MFSPSNLLLNQPFALVCVCAGAGPLPAAGEGERHQPEKEGDAAEELLVADSPPGTEPEVTLARLVAETKESAKQREAATPSRQCADIRIPPNRKEAAAASDIQSRVEPDDLGLGPTFGHAVPVSDILTKIADVQKKLQQAVLQSSKDSQRGMRDELKKESTRLELLYRQEVWPALCLCRLCHSPL